MQNLLIGTRLRIAFGSMFFLICLVGAIGFIQLAHLHSGTEQLAQKWMGSIRALSDVQGSLNTLRRVHLRHVFEISTEGKTRQLERAKKAEAELASAWRQYRDLVSGAEEQQLADDFQRKLALWMSADEKLFELSNGGERRFAEARTLAIGETSQLFNEALNVLLVDIKLNQKGGSDEAARANTAYERSKSIFLLGVGMSAALSMLLAWFTGKSIVVPLNQALGTVNAVAKGDLTSHIEIHGRDESAQLLHAMIQMQTDLTGVVANLRRYAESVATSSLQITQGNRELSQRTEEQATALEETAATMEQISGALLNNASNARRASQLAQHSSSIAERGGIAVTEMIDTMNSINSSSRKIGDIIGVIDSIAFQTNILALNAAVEAARAGEQGRGFAVVASEVRVLAKHSAEAAKEIKQLVMQNIEQVEQGARLVSSTGSTMVEVVGSIKQVSDVISEISTATTEQNAGITQVASAVTQLDQVTQQNAAMVEESAMAAESLKEQAQHLVELVSSFILREHSGDTGTQPNTASGERVGTAEAFPKTNKLALLSNVSSVIPEDRGLSERRLLRMNDTLRKK